MGNKPSIPKETPSDPYSLYLLPDNKDETLAELRDKIKEGSAVILYPDNQDASSSSSGVRKYNAHVIQQGKWVAELGRRKEVALGNLKINTQGLLTAKDTTNYAGIIEDALLKCRVISDGVNYIKVTSADIIKDSLRSHLTLSEASLFSRTNTESYGQLHPQVEVDTLLLHIARGEQDEAEKMIIKKPGLLLQKGNVTDIAGRDFEKTTAFQLALWGWDRHMWEMILKYLPQDNAREQLQELENTPTYTICLMPENIRLPVSEEPKIVGLDGIEVDEIKLEENELKENTLYVKKISQPQMDGTTTNILHYSVKTVDEKIKEGIISEAELSLSIEENTLNNLLPAILKATTKRKHTAGHGAHFDEKPLLEAYQAYITQCNILMATRPPRNYDVLGKPWLAIGKQQRLLPVAALNEFCRRDRSFCVGANNMPPAFDDKVLQRELRLDGDYSFLPLRPTSGLGFDCNLFRGAEVEGALAVSGGRVKIDLVALGRLYEVRNAELVQLNRELNPAPAPGL